MTTSLRKRWRYSIASVATCATASGSSPFTWNTGHLEHAHDVGAVRVERLIRGTVVKPTWLLTIRWTLPPVE
jgi:hypothetical protein